MMYWNGDKEVDWRDYQLDLMLSRIEWLESVVCIAMMIGCGLVVAAVVIFIWKTWG